MLTPYIDLGTDSYPNPPAEVTHSAEHDPEPTGAHPGPPESVTVESPPEHLSKPTGAVEGPPPSVTHTQHPHGATAKAKAVRRSDVDDKAVTLPSPPVDTKKGGS